jgi:hypothetical protein
VVEREPEPVAQENLAYFINEIEVDKEEVML